MAPTLKQGEDYIMTEFHDQIYLASLDFCFICRVKVIAPFQSCVAPFPTCLQKPTQK